MKYLYSLLALCLLSTAFAANGDSDQTDSKAKVHRTTEAAVAASNAAVAASEAAAQAASSAASAM